MLRLQSIHIGTGIDQDLAGFDVSFASSVLQRCHSAFGSLHQCSAAGFFESAELKMTRMGIDVRASLDEEPGHFRLVLGRSEHKRRVSLEFVGVVDVRSPFDEQLHRIETAGA